MIVKKDDGPQWLMSMRERVQYRLHLISSVDKTWQIEVASIADPTLKVRLDLPGTAVQQADYMPYLRAAQFKFIEIQQERADAERKRRLERRNAEFERAVQTGSFGEPEGAPEVAGGAAPSAQPSGGQDRSLGAGANSEDRGAGADGVPAESKATAGTDSSSRPRRGRAKGRKGASSDSDRSSRNTAET